MDADGVYSESAAISFSLIFLIFNYIFANDYFLISKCILHGSLLCFPFLSSFNLNSLELVVPDTCPSDSNAGSAKFSSFQHISWLIFVIVSVQLEPKDMLVCVLWSILSLFYCITHSLLTASFTLPSDWLYVGCNSSEYQLKKMKFEKDSCSTDTLLDLATHCSSFCLAISQILEKSSSVSPICHVFSFLLHIHVQLIFSFLFSIAIGKILTFFLSLSFCLFTQYFGAIHF